MTTRIPLPMAAPPAPALKACTECGKCCTYVSVGINPPRTLRFASDVLWYLYHDGVSVYCDGDGDWSVVRVAVFGDLVTELHRVLPATSFRGGAKHRFARHARQVGAFAADQPVLDECD